MRTVCGAALCLALFAGGAAGEDPAPSTPPAKAPKIERKVAKSVLRVLVSPDGKWVCGQAAASPPVVFSTSDTRRFEPFKEFPKPDDPALQTTLQASAFTADSKFLVVDAQEVPKKSDVETFKLLWNRMSRSVQVVDLETGAVARSIEVRRLTDSENGMEDSVSRIQAELKGSVVRLERRHRVEYWDCGTGNLVREVEEKNPIWETKCSANTKLAAATYLHFLAVSDASSGRELWRIELDKTPYKGKAFDAIRGFNVHGFTTDGAVLVVRASWCEDLPASAGSKAWANRRAVDRTDGYSAQDGKLLWSRDGDETQFDSNIGAGVFAEIRSGRVLFVDAATGKPRDTPVSDKTYTCGAFESDGLVYWAGTSDGQILKIKSFAAPNSK